jgi:3-oxoacid CoA-transferase
VNKQLPDPETAVSQISDGATIAIGGFGLPGAPIELMGALARTTTTDLVIIANNGAMFDWQLGSLLEQGRIRRIIASHIGLNPVLEHAYRSGLVEVELIPQGTMVERLRAAGAGLPAFFTPTGVGTVVEHGGLPWRFDSHGKTVLASPPRETRTFAGRRYVLEEALRPDFALVRAQRGDRHGNLAFHQSARNFNPIWATAARVTLAEVEQLVEPGTIDPDQVHTPGVCVDAVVEIGTEGKWHELPMRTQGGSAQLLRDPRHRIARRAALEFEEGTCVNLGVGIPSLAASYTPSNIQVILHSENGVLGLGPPPNLAQASFDLTDASKCAATIIEGGAFLDSAAAFSIIRNGRLDLTILGAMQVSERGDLANWIVPGKSVAGIGGAMDLAVGARRVVVTMLHNDNEGVSKVVDECTYPLTAAGVVDRIITEKAVLDVTPDGLVLRELAPGFCVDDVIAATKARLLVPSNPLRMSGYR